MERNLMDKPVYLIGDPHNLWNKMWVLIDYWGIADCEIYCVGDMEIGLNSDPYETANALARYDWAFSKRNIVFHSIRGNHDNPHFFDGTYQYNNFKLLKDFTVLDINGLKTLFVGGGLSINRSCLTAGVDYFLEELTPEINIDALEKYDRIVSHDRPTFVNLHPNGLYDEEGNPVATDGLKQRTNIEKLVNCLQGDRPKWYYGHYHNSDYDVINGIVYRCVNILEIIPFD